VVVLGTATEVGKTWAACALAAHLRAGGRTVAARKPAQSFDPADRTAGGPTDADLLAAATGGVPHAVCPAHRWYPCAMAPPMAADALGRDPIALADLLDELDWPAQTDVGIVEAAGGTRSPLAHDGDGIDLVRALAPDLTVVVADAGLGTISAVRTALQDVLPPVTVLLNRFDGTDDLHVRNLAWLRTRDGYDVETDVGALAARLAPLTT
jgi:dethiobiotin synthetase